MIAVVPLLVLSTAPHLLFVGLLVAGAVGLAVFGYRIARRR